MKRRSIVLALILALLAPGLALAADLPTAKPEQVGLSSERLARITQVLRADVERGRIPGAVVVVARKGRVAYVQAVGFRDKTEGTPMTPDAIFRIASMTKPIVTVAALSLYEEGRLLLADPVSKYIPALKTQTVGVERAPVEREMTIQDLMRHTSGLTYGNRGTTEIYKMYPESSNVSSLTLTMDEFILLNRGRLEGARVLGTKTVELMTSDHLGQISRGTNYFAGPGYTWGLGVSVREANGLAPMAGTAGDYFWPGAFATYWWADPKEEMVVVSMMQSPLGRHYIPLLRALVLQAIVE